MPSNSRPLTIILNANQSKRTTYLLPLSPSQSQHALILTEARNKFRLKSLSQIFLKGGTLFQPDEVLHSDVREVWVSKGEPYVGKEAPGPGPKRIGPEEEARVDVIAEESYVDPESMKQLKVVAGLEGVVAAIGMPDLHPGNRFPIGCAIAAHGVYPALIGTDVGCGIALYRLASTPSRFAPSKLAARLRGLDDPWDGDVAAWLADRGVHKESEFDKTSLGTVGAGNHFAEVCVVEEVKDAEACERIGVRTGVVYLLVHTGSRGLGKSILQAHSKTNSNPYYPGGTPELDAYLAEHDYAVRWAVANRDLVAYRIASCLGLSWDSSDDTETSDSEQPRGPKPVMPEKLVDVTHNSVTRHALALGNKEAQDVWIHRKGAAPADMGVAPCPGSRGDFSWLLQPVGDGNDNAHSLAHGAGRLHPRGAATLHKNVPGSTTSLGSEVVCTDTALMMEERPEAYKGVQAVVDDLEKRGCAKGIAKLRPVVTYKVRNETTRK